jgi:CheY-like chemotaxis protein
MRVEPDSGSLDPGVLRFRVTDTGVGIPPEEQQRIFSRFAQAASTISGGHHGSGLGLDISRRLVEAMGGMIWVESQPGIGSSFYFTCRMRVQPAPHADISARSRLTGIRVLVVDDNAASRASIAEMLSDAGASVSLRDGAAQAREELHAPPSGTRFQVILLDALLPPDGGVELARSFGSSDRACTIVMLTRDNFPHGPRLARAAGLDRHLLKPITPAALLDAVESVAQNVTGAQRPVAPPAANPPSKAAGPPPLSILLAEDSEDNRLLIAAYLRTTPHQLDTAENGRVAVEMFKTKRYDLVLADVNMPVLDGLGAVSAIREWEREQGLDVTPIVTLTGRATPEDRRKALEVGCNGHLTKPLRREMLMQAIAQFTDAPASP